ncbi:MAG: ubiquinone-binding protein, partial [Neisseriales bacterium]
FMHLKGHWIFTPLAEYGCKVDFKLDYKFSNIIIEKVIGAVFEFVIKNIVDSFVKKAHEIYRK